MPTVLLSMLPPILWLAFFLIVYIFEIMGCRFALGAGPILAVNGIVTVLTLAAVCAVAWMSWRRHQRLPEGEPSAWLARLSLLLCGTTLIATVWVGLPLLLVPPCQ